MLLVMNNWTWSHFSIKCDILSPKGRKIYNYKYIVHFLKKHFHLLSTSQTINYLNIKNIIHNSGTWKSYLQQNFLNTRQYDTVEYTNKTISYQNIHQDNKLAEHLTRQKITWTSIKTISYLNIHQDNKLPAHPSRQ